MKIYNQEKNKELQNVDLTKGYLQPDKLFVKHIDKIEEQCHYETIKEYPNGGKDVKKIIDVIGVPEHDVFEDIQAYILYSEKELAEQRISELKQMLFDTDYKAIKYAEGELPYAEYESTRKQRREWRAEINRLEQQLNG